MADLPGFVWLLILGAGGLSALTMLAAAAAWLRHECTVHDLRVEALRLRAEYERSIRKINAGDAGADDEEEEVFLTV